jgi:hypothetical protein
MDSVGKRIVFFQSLAVLQFAKIYQWFFHPWTWESVGFWQWLLIDVLVLLYAHKAGLKFPLPARTVYLGLFIFSLLLNISLAHFAVFIQLLLLLLLVLVLVLIPYPNFREAPSLLVSLVSM